MTQNLAIVAAASLWIACPVCAQPLSINYRGVTPLGASAVDQNGQSFTVAGLSGITHMTGTSYVAVMDNSNKLVRLSISLNGDGSIASATIVGGVSLALTRDFEGVAYTSPARNSVLLSEETTPAVHEFDLATGALLQSFATPPVFANIVPNRGFESLARRADGGEAWTCNEEALTVDGPLSTRTAGTTVRLLRYAAAGTALQSAQQFAYLTQPIHAGTSGQSGVSDLVELPSGELLALERSFTSNGLPFFQSRIYEVGLTGATDVSGFTSGLLGQTYAPVGKRLLWSGSVNNCEGLALGQRLANGNHALIGIVDDGDPISTNALVAFELVGDIEPVCTAQARCDLNCDGSVNIFDIEPFVAQLLPAAPQRCAPCAGDTNADGSVTLFDIQGFVDCLTEP